MSAIAGVVTTEEDLREPLESLRDALDHPKAERFGLAAGGVRRQAASPEDLDLAELDASWALLHVAGPAPGDEGQPVTRDGLACCVEDAAASPTIGEPGEGEGPAERLADRLEAALGETGELGAALQSLADELVHVSAHGAASPDGLALQRDANGSVPLYAGRGEERAAFATSREPLWSLGLEADRVKPDTLVLLHPRRSQTIHLPRNEAPPGTGTPGDLEAHAEALRAAVRRRVDDLDEVGLMGTHPAAAAALARALREATDAELRAYVPDRDHRKVNEAIARGLEPHVDALEAVALEPDSVSEDLGDLLHALEDRHQDLVADAIPPYALSRAAARDGVRVLLADRGPAEPHAHEALDVAEGRGTGPSAPDPIAGEGPLERAHKLAREAGVVLRAPRADPAVVPHDASAATEGEGVAGRLARLAEHLGAEPVPSPPVVETETEHLRELLVEVADRLEVPPRPDVYEPAQSLNQGGRGAAEPGRAIVALRDPEGLDAALQWGLDHAALEAGAVGPDETQRLRRYLEDVQAHGGSGP